MITALFDTLQLRSAQIWLHITFPSHLGLEIIYRLHGGIAGLFTEAALQKTRLNHVVFTACSRHSCAQNPSQPKSHRAPWGLQWPGDSQPKPFRPSEVFCLLTPLLQRYSTLSKDDEAARSLISRRWHPRSGMLSKQDLKEHKGKCLWKICFKWLRTPNSHNENHKVNLVPGMW